MRHLGLLHRATTCITVQAPQDLYFVTAKSRKMLKLCKCFECKYFWLCLYDTNSQNRKHLCINKLGAFCFMILELFCLNWCRSRGINRWLRAFRFKTKVTSPFKCLIPNLNTYGLSIGLTITCFLNLFKASFTFCAVLFPCSFCSGVNSRCFIRWCPSRGPSCIIPCSGLGG